MRVGVAATPWVALPTLDWLSSSEHELALVITQPDRPAGRGRSVRQSAVGEWAQAHNVPVVKPESSLDLLRELDGLDLVITIGYGVILPIAVLSIPKFGFINLHFSLLPAWRGAAPVPRAILNGDRTSGVSVFQLDAGMDTGPIYVSRQMAIDRNENAGQLLERMAAVGPEVISQTLELIAHQRVPVPQESDGASYAAKISREDSRIAWTQSALVVDRQVRAYTPEPGAWTLWRGEPLRISKANIATSGASLMPGEISKVDNLLLVGCGSKEVMEIVEVTPAGKRVMNATEWLNGARLSAGDFFV